MRLIAYDWIPLIFATLSVGVALLRDLWRSRRKQ
jgi:hypothetical protein